MTAGIPPSRRAASRSAVRATRSEPCAGSGSPTARCSASACSPSPTPRRPFSYCLLDTPIPLLNYVAHVALHRVTDGDRTFWRWWSEFDTPRGQERKLGTLVGEDIYMRGFAAIRRHLAA